MCPDFGEVLGSMAWPCQPVLPDAMCAFLTAASPRLRRPFRCCPRGPRRKSISRPFAASGPSPHPDRRRPVPPRALPRHCHARVPSLSVKKTEPSVRLGVSRRRNTSASSPALAELAPRGPEKISEEDAHPGLLRLHVRFAVGHGTAERLALHAEVQRARLVLLARVAACLVALSAVDL